jgi:hypothetical protein
MRDALVIVQVALSLVLLTGSGLFLRGLQRASSIDIGMRPDNVLLMAVDPKLHRYSPEKTRQFIAQLRERVSALPEVRQVTFLDSVPLSIGGTGFTFKTESGKEGVKSANADVYGVGAGFFETMQLPLRRGREFGIRIALGAHNGGVLALAARQGLWLAGAGMAIGLGIALGLSRYAASLLYGVSATDAATFLTVPVMLAAVALAAVHVPAVRAARVSPVNSLRYE